MIRATLLSFALTGGLISAQAPGFPPPCSPGQHAPDGMGRPGPRGPVGPMALFKALGLTQDQEKALKAVLDRHKAAGMAREMAAAAQEDRLRDAVEDPAVPEARLRALHLAAGEARLQALLEHRAVVQEINALLTPDQTAKARRIREGLQREQDAHRAVAAELGDGQEPPCERN